jgi:hypothetical protein
VNRGHTLLQDEGQGAVAEAEAEAAGRCAGGVVRRPRRRRIGYTLTSNLSTPAPRIGREQAGWPPHAAAVVPELARHGTAEPHRASSGPDAPACLAIIALSGHASRPQGAPNPTTVRAARPCRRSCVLNHSYRSAGAEMPVLTVGMVRDTLERIRR